MEKRPPGSALGTAEYVGRTAKVELLVEKAKGADQNFVIGDEEGPIYHAAKGEHAGIEKYLLDVGASIDEAGKWANKQGLLDKGANHSHKNRMGDHHVSQAVDSDNSHILKDEAGSIVLNTLESESGGVREAGKERVAVVDARYDERDSKFGGSFSSEDKDDNTAAPHLLIKQWAAYPQRAKTYLAVFKEKLEQATMRKDLEDPHGNTKTYDPKTREAVIELLTGSRNKADLSLIGLACQAGAADIVQLIMSTSQVMCFKRNEGMLYNATNMTPGCYIKGDSAPLQSYIELVLSLKNAEMASKVLDVQPFREIEDAYSVTTAWTYSLVMLVHIAYMSLLSYYGIQLLEERRKNPTDHSFTTAKIILYTVVPLEPAVIVLYNMYSMAKGSCAGTVSLREVKQSFRKSILRLFNRILPVAFGVIYAVLVIVWIVLYSVDYTNMDYFLSFAVCMGWLYTTNFTRGFRLINYFWRMIQKMIIEDILKFLFIYFFVLLAFSFAIHAMFQISPLQTDVYSSAWDTMFLVFNLMIGMGNLFDDTLETNMSAVGRNTKYLKVVYVVYMVLSTILLLNLLIAMMNDSYSAILKQHSVDWRLESVQFGVDIERVFPWSTRVFSRIDLRTGASIKRQQHDESNKYLEDKDWYITVKTNHIEEDGAEETEIDAIKHDLDDLRGLLRNLTHFKTTLPTDKSESTEAVA